MRAAVLQHAGQPVTIEAVRLDPPQAGEVLVRIQASGVCHSDLHVRDGEWPRPGPFVIGHEGAGVVEALGPGVDPATTGLTVGQAVALSWYAPCGHCPACRAGREWLCSDSGSSRHRMSDGSTRLHRLDGAELYPYCGLGTLAEATVVPASAAIPMPAGAPPEVAALIGCCVSTGVGAVLKTARVPAGASVVVIGLGGVGLSVVMGAVLAGAATIVAVDRIPAKLARARELGAMATVLAGTDAAATDAQIRDLTGGGPDFVFEAIGLAATIEQAIGLLPPGGTAVLVGMTPFGVRAAFEVFPFVDGSRSILGSNYGFAVAALDFPRYAQLYLDGRLPIDRLIERRIGLDDVEAAFDRLRAGDGLRNVVTF
ncbi:MAG TPA: alcohol dehydrogenase catalytic domain-containing protein [Candidatus Limnocylindrales bacterium]|nr:alcohol dehydrogenase catalytic domain-containing protein [Candidatus Limnocylindrales bacterium]